MTVRDTIERCMEEKMDEVTFAKLHDELFFGGKNFNKRLEPSSHNGLKIFEDEKKNRLIAFWMGSSTRIPMPNVSNYSTDLGKDRKLVQMAHPHVVGIGAAQVQTPMGHVHAGPGHGKTSK